MAEDLERAELVAMSISIVELLSRNYIAPMAMQTR